jgi:hypothetical protein
MREYLRSLNSLELVLPSLSAAREAATSVEPVRRADVGGRLVFAADEGGG